MSYNIDFVRISGLKDPLEEVEEVLETRTHHQRINDIVVLKLKYRAYS